MTPGGTASEIRYQPIGVVHSPHVADDHVPPRRIERRGVEGTIEVFPQYTEGLRDLEGFSHIVLLCHLHLSSGYSLTVKPPSDTRTHGLFASRSPRRPNPISLTVVRLRRIEGNVLHVVDLDIIDGTPLLDIKPYFASTYDGDEVRTGWMEARRGR
jgi:tRNA-Thr(GGU) m(6)t(6)A37 methyltransferase TsaA